MVIQNGLFLFGVVNWSIYPQEVSVAELYSATPVQSDGVLMVLVDLLNCPNFILFIGVRFSLVLYSALVTHVKGWKEVDMLSPFIVINHVPVPQGFLFG